MGFLKWLLGGSGAKRPRRSGRTYRRRRPREDRGVVSYHRIMMWIVSRIGPLDASDPYLHEKLLTLVDEEKRADPPVYTEGLEAYITTNTYRQMLAQPQGSTASMETEEQ